MLRSLLDKWVASGDVALQDEPEGTFVLKHPRCHEARRGEPDAWCVVHGGFWHGWRVSPDRPADHAHILAATIEAIDARGYSPWHLSRDEDGFAADVTRYPSGYAVTVYGPDKCPTAVEALLSAYLSALEAES